MTESDTWGDGDAQSGSDAADATHDTTDTRVDTTTDTASDPDGEPDPPLGMCGPLCPGADPCPEGAFCEYGVMDITHMCTTGGCGLCAWVPEDCPPEHDPVCGCNGVVYDGACARRLDRAQPDLGWIHCPLPEPDPDIVEDGA